MLWENTWLDYILLDNNFNPFRGKKQKSILFNGMLFLYCVGVFCKILRLVTLITIEPIHRPKASLAGAEV
jgi:hypothetical protein